MTISTYDGGGDLKKRWHVSLLFTRPSKKRIQIYAGINRIPTKKERRKALNDLKRATIELLQQGYDFLKTETIAGNSIIEQLDLVLNEKKKQLRKESIAIYTSSLNHFKDFLIGRNYHQYKKIEKIHVAQFKGHLLDCNCSKKSINVYMSCCRALFGNLPGANPFSNFGQLKVNDASKRNIPFREEHWLVMKQEINDNYPALLLLLQGMYYTGLRVKEMLAVKVQDIDFAAGRIFIKGAYTKSGRTETIQLPDRYKEELYTHLSEVPLDFYVFGGNRENKPSESPASASSFRSKFIRVRSKLNLDGMGYTMYSTRHKVACDLADQGVSIKNISNFLRHSSISMTEKYLRSMGRRVDDEVIKNFPDF